MNIGMYHVATYRAGEAGYVSPRPRGHVEVWHDSKRYLYDLRGLNVKAGEARLFVKSAWHSMNGTRVTGRYPSYTVE